MTTADQTRWIKDRRSIRKYRPEPLPDEVVRDILECARLAPTARNIQPWLIGAITDRSLRAEIAELTEYGKFIKESPACFAVFVRAGEKYFMEDGCAATMNIILAAAAHGVGTCWVAGHKKEYVEPVRILLGVPDGYTLISLVAAGYSEQTPDPQKKSLEEIVFFDRYQ